MKVTLVNHSDTLGGASVVTYRLMEALCRAGVDARMLVVRRATDDSRVALAGNALTRKAAFIAEHLRIVAGNGFSRRNLFKISIASAGLPLHRHPWIKDADVVALNWVNQGMLSLRGIRRIAAMGKPVVWTMHDMWCMTGVCHHAGDCEGFLRDCGNCPLIKDGKDARDMSRSTFRRKERLYDRVSLHFVAVSRWLASRAKDSALLRDEDVCVIPNAFPVAEFPLTPSLSRAELGLPEGKRLIVMGAARLDDPIKGLPVAVEALNILADKGCDAVAVFYGAMRDPAALDGLRLPHISLGTISDRRRLASLYAHADAVISTSQYETLPGTLIEGMAAGCVPVTFGRGGQADIVDHLDTGYIARYGDPVDFASGIEFALGCADEDRDRRSATVADRFSDDAVASEYIDLFNRLLQK
ncbi:MAG: glycosyltransferase [Muribaculaceae bacterium]